MEIYCKYKSSLIAYRLGYYYTLSIPFNSIKEAREAIDKLK